MSKPINYKDENCESKSSNCIIWAGPKIDCISLCSGDSITLAVYNLATELCEIMNQLDLTNYDLTCLGISGGQPKDFKAFINILIQKICAANGTISDSRSSSDGSFSNVTVTLAACFQYQNPSNGDMVTTAPITDYVQLIGIRICTITSQIEALQQSVAGLTSRVNVLENKTPYQYTLPNIYSTCIADPTTPIPLDEFVVALENYLCQLSQSVGSVSKVYNAITSQPDGLNTAPALGTGGGTMGSKIGWAPDVKDLADSLTNVWIVLADIRSAITNIKLNCCTTLCDGIELVFDATLEAKNLKLFFTGVIPSNLQSCLSSGALFKIEDYSGNSVNVSVDIKNNLNNVSGYSIDLNSSPLNFADDLKVSTVFCFNDPDTSSVCQNYLEVLVNNTTDCPSVSITPGTDSVAYQFSHTSGTLTYSVQLFNGSNIMIQSKNIFVGAPVVISDLFTGLSSNTLYKIRVQMITALNTKSCPMTPFSTLYNPCPPVLTASAVINIV